jgi:hypothetical protein
MTEATDSRAGASCRITLGSRETIRVNHSKGGFQGGILAVEILTFMGLCSERLSSPATSMVRRAGPPSPG